MKTPEEIINYLADQIGHIYFHPRPQMFASTAVELDRVLFLYHEIWSEIVEKSRDDLIYQIDNSCGFAIPYAQKHPDATEEEIAKEVVRRWAVVSRNLEVPIPYEALSKKFQAFPQT